MNLGGDNNYSTGRMRCYGVPSLCSRVAAQGDYSLSLKMQSLLLKYFKDLKSIYAIYTNIHVTNV